MLPNVYENYAYTCMYVCMYVCACMYVCMYSCKYCACVYISVCVRVSMDSCKYDARARARARVCVCVMLFVFHFVFIQYGDVHGPVVYATDKSTAVVATFCLAISVTRPATRVMSWTENHL